MQYYYTSNYTSTCYHLRWYVGVNTAKRNLFQDKVRIGHPDHPATSPEDFLLQESCTFPVRDLLLDRAIPERIVILSQTAGMYYYPT